MYKEKRMSDETQKEKRNIKTLADTQTKYLSTILDEEDVKQFKALTPELKDTWTKKQMFRTETEMRFSVLNDAKYPTKAAKYWQSVREQNTHFENLMHLSFDYRKNDIEIEKLERKIEEEKDDLEKKLLKIELEEKLYGKASMELVAKHRMREVNTWSKLKKEFDDNSFDKQDVNSHQAKSYLLGLENRVKSLTPGTSQPEVFNAVGQLESLKRVIKQGELLPAEERLKLQMSGGTVALPYGEESKVSINTQQKTEVPKENKKEQSDDIFIKDL